jgi:hypothetical protein
MCPSHPITGVLDRNPSQFAEMVRRLPEETQSEHRSATAANCSIPADCSQGSLSPEEI